MVTWGRRKEEQRKSEEGIVMAMGKYGCGALLPPLSWFVCWMQS